MLAPVEYLTYEIREVFDLMRLVGVDAHIDPRLLLRSVGADDLAQPSGAPERYGCGTPLAGAVRPTAARADVGISPYTLNRTNDVRLSYVKYLPRCDISVYEIGRAARRAFLDLKCNGNT